MKRFPKLLPLLGLSLLFFISCNQGSETTNSSDDLSVFNADSLKHDLAVIASDSLLGRKPFTEGERKTIGFLEKRYKEIGLDPGNGDSYVQAVPMVNIEAKAAPQMEVKSGSGNFTLKAFDDLYSLIFSNPKATFFKTARLYVWVFIPVFYLLHE